MADCPCRTARHSSSGSSAAQRSTARHRTERGASEKEAGELGDWISGGGLYDWIHQSSALGGRRTDRASGGVGQDPAMIIDHSSTGSVTGGA